MDEGDYRAFADCFVEYEEREDEEGETYTVAIPIQSLNMVYGNLAAELNQEVSLEDKTNVQRIYMDRILNSLSEDDRQWLDDQLMAKMDIPEQERLRYYKAGLADAIELIHYLRT